MRVCTFVWKAVYVCRDSIVVEEPPTCKITTKKANIEIVTWNFIGHEEKSGPV